MERCKVLIADDHPFMRQGLRALFEGEAQRFSLVGEAADGLELVALMKQQRPDLLVTDIAMPHLSGLEALLAGRRVRSEAVAAILADEATTSALTGRELQVLMGIARGDNNAAIAERLGITANTVDKHRTNMMRKLGVHSAAELLALAVRDGLLDTSRTL